MEEMAMKADSGSTKFSRRGLLAAAMTVAVLAAMPFAGARAAAPAANGKPKIGIIGSGNVGSNLGRVWAKAGYAVMFSSKDIEADRKLATQVGSGARAGTPQEAAAFGDVLVFAVPYGALPELGQTLGSALKGKIAIDASNPFAQRDGAIADEARAQGAGVVSARLLPGARIVRAFNAIGAARMGAVHETPGAIGMPTAGDDAAAIEVASRLIKDIGFEPVIVGGLAMGKYLMPGTPLAGEHTPDEIRKIAAMLKP
jgi:predicted dinucleotide-binding enzyme